MSAVETLAQRFRVRRSTAVSRVGAFAAVPILALLIALPYLVGRGTQQNLVTLFELVVIATMWNLLAGYSGLVSIGQQCFVGIGAYGLVYCADILGVNPFLALPLAAIVAGVLSIPISFVAFRLIGGYFAIGTWVIAEVVKLIMLQVDTLGGGAGITLQAFSGYTPVYRVAYVYWASLAILVAAVAVTYLLVRSRIGLGFMATRDEATAAASLGVDVTRSKRIVYVVASMGTALAGGMIAANTLRIQPDSIFNVSYSAYALFIVVIGGIGTIEGPIIGAVIFWVLQQQLADLGTWYLVILGVLAILVVLFLPAGVWGLVSGRGRIQVFPAGYRLVRPKVAAETRSTDAVASRSVS